MNERDTVQIANDELFEVEALQSDDLLAEAAEPAPNCCCNNSCNVAEN